MTDTPDPSDPIQGIWESVVGQLNSDDRITPRVWPMPRPLALRP